MKQAFLKEGDILEVKKLNLQKKLINKSKIKFNMMTN